MQVYEAVAGEATHLPALLQVCPAQKSTGVSHLEPVKLGLHVQTAVSWLADGLHCPWFWHGLGLHTAE